MQYLNAKNGTKEAFADPDDSLFFMKDNS